MPWPVAIADAGRGPRERGRGKSPAVSSAGSLPTLQQADDFARRCVAMGFRLLEYRHAVGRDLEPPAARRHEIHARIRKPLSNLGRQPDGPRFVASHRAVFDRDAHLVM